MTTVDASFVNNFWGKDEQGSKVVFNRMNQGQQTSEELMEFYREKIQIEQEYAFKLAKLSQKTLGSKETGTIKQAFELLKHEISIIGESHLNESRQLENEVLAPLGEFNKKYSDEISHLEQMISSILSSKQQLFQQIEKSKTAYSNECIKLYNFYAKNNSKNGNSPAYRTTLLQFEDNLQLYRSKYEMNVKNHKKVLNKWVNLWQEAANNLQDLEFERINYLKTNIWNHLNLIAATCVKDDKACENVRIAIEKCDSLQDIKEFVEKFRTGSEIYEAPEFVDFLDEMEDPNMSQTKYSHANFENSFSSLQSSLQFAGKNKQKQVTFTSSTNAGSSYYGDSLNSRIKQENDLPKLTEESNDETFKKQFDSLSFKKEEEEEVQKFEIKSPFGTIQTVSRSPTKSTPQVKMSPNTSPSLDPSTFRHEMESLSGSSTNETNSLARQNTYASSHTSSNFSNSSNKTWNSPTRRKSKMSMQTWVAEMGSPTKNTVKITEEKQAQVDRYYESNKNEDSVLNTSTMRNFNPEEVGVDDPLRAALEDLKIGGNGDFNALKERHNSIKSNRSLKQKKPAKETQLQISQLLQNPHRKSMIDLMKQSSQNTVPQQQQTKPYSNPSRPKSMIEIAEMNQLKTSVPAPQSFNSSMQTNANFKVSTAPSANHLNSSMYSAKPKKIPVAPNGLPLISSDGRAVLRHAKAAYEYKASIPEEVSFKRKDLMLVLAMQDDGWWEVEVLGNLKNTNNIPKHGLAPSNYLVPA